VDNDEVVLDILIGSMTKAQTTILHRQNRTVINAHAAKVRMDNSAHGQLRARTIARTGKYAQTNTHMYNAHIHNTIK
jgi:hypothetical protein